MSNSNILKVGSLLSKFPNNGSKVKLPQELKDKLVSVVSAYGKSNSDEDRDIIKDKTGNGNDFQILNADYKLNSSFGKYEIDFTTWSKNSKITSVDSESFNFTTNATWFLLYCSTNIGKDIPSFKVRIKINKGQGNAYYNYITKEGKFTNVIIRTEEFETPISYNTLYVGDPINIGFTFDVKSEEECSGTITQIPSFQGAFTTNGIDDLIMSQKSVSDMLDGSNEYTVLSMIHHIDVPEGNRYSNVIRIKLNSWGASNKITSSSNNKTGIYGYTVKDTSVTIINNILGDKNDYDIRNGTDTSNLAAKFSVIGWIGEDDILRENSSIAWYWTVIAKAVLTTDEINQVIAYYNLDRPGEIVKPDILYDVKRQGITNENHAEFNDELIDFSGNNYNLKLYNMLWDKQSGIGNYPISFKDYTYVSSRATVQVNKDNFIITSNSNTGNFLEVNTKNKTLPIYKVKVEGTNTITNGVLSYRFNNTEGVISRMSIPEDGEYEIPESPSTVDSIYSGWCINGGINENINVRITLLAIDDITDAVVLDGISNFGKVTNVPIYKDYTICALRKWLSNTSKNAGGIFSKSEIANSGAFILEQTFNINPSVTSTWNFGVINQYMNNDKLNEKSITAQTKFTYNYNGQDFKIGNGLDYSNLWFGIIRDRESKHSNVALWNAMLFPYSLSEFLLERQLKKYKLGTLYPNMVEWRPIVSSNTEYQSILYFNKADGKSMVVGQYYPADTSIQISILPTQPNKVNKITVNGKEPIFLNNKDGIYRYEWHFDDKSPQQIKLKLGIDETLVQFNPIINSNVEYKKEEYFIINNNIWTKINSLDYISIGQKIAIKIYLNGIVDKLIAATSLDLENISSISKASGENSYYFLANVTSKSPQNINIVIDEYIRYEDIKQPYPIYLTYKQDDKILTWGDIIKVGTIIRVSNNTRLMSNQICQILGYHINNSENLLSWNQLINTDIPVEKDVVGVQCDKTWNISTPNFAYDPSFINNIGLKNLGYLPDITGQNNNLDLYNFKYIPNSGKGQYLIDFNNWRLVRSTLDKQVVKFNRDEFVGSVFFCGFLGTNKVDIPSFTVNIDFSSNKEGACPHYYFWDENGNRNSIDLIKGLNILPANYASKSDDSMGSGFHDTLCDTVTIEQVAFNEEALCFDGIDNYGNIPSITNVKSILMQVKWSYLGKILYDQRKNYNSEFAILSDDTNLNGDKIYAYQARNNGNTYIQGFLNKNLYASVLKDLLHNIIITNDLTEIGQNPYIGCTIETTYFSKMAMYKVMGFDKVISEDEIKLLNENWLGLGNNFIYLNPNIQIDTTLAIKDIKLFQNNEEVNKGYLFTGAQNGVEFELRVSLAEGKYGLDEITVDGETISSSSEIDGYKVFKFTINGSSEQNIIVHSYEYIMYEDISQPYPAFFYYNDKETKRDYIWGDKIKVGSIINVRSIDNLLPDLYTINSYILNGKSLNYSALISKDIVVNNDLSVGCITTYKLEGFAPKCIFSPEKLRIPNSSYKYLGYIPDISGNGNNGVFNNFAFSGMSGANGYTYDYNKTSDFAAVKKYVKIINSEKFEYFGYTNSVTFYKKTSSYKGKIKITGLNNAIASGKVKHFQIYTNSTTDTETSVFTIDGIFDINIIGVGDATNVYFYILPTNTSESGILNNPITIEQIGEYDGSIYFDGVNDFVIIPTLVTKQSLIKCNWTTENYNKFLVDYRKDNASNGYSTNKTGSSDTQLAYNGRITYIDGILNKNLIPDDNLKGITHCAVIQYPSNIESETTIASAFDLRGYMQMALYTYIAFSEFSTDEEIKQLNNIIGIEGNFVEWNPTITANVSSTYAISPNIRKSDGITVKLVKGNIYSTSITGNLVLDIVPPNKVLDEVTNVIIDGKSYTPIKYQYADYYRVEIPLIFPQEINITIDEYITYETIEQPYPIFLNYIDKETNKAYTWGDKVKVGSLLKISDYKNLFENGEISLGGSNGYSINGSSELVALGTLLTSEILVNKINTGVKSSVIWNLDTPKPLFAYDPSIINNIGLKNLGYLPDITGQGRHLLLDGFAYEGMSGVNGYPVVFGENKTWEAQGTKDGDKYYIYTSNANKFNITQIKISSSLFYTYIKRNGELTSGNKDISSFNLKVTGLNYDKFYLAYYYLKSADVEVRNVINITSDGIYELPKSFASDGSLTETNSYIGLSFIRKSSEIPDVIQNVNVTIEALPNYEGSLYFDGVNDKGTVQNLTYGGKCLISKVNFEFNQSSIILYDQRATASSGENNNTFALLASKITEDIAYGLRLTGNTYINNVLNNYIRSSELENIEHTLTMTSNVVSEKNSVTPVFGCSVRDVDYAKFAMYKTILLSEIPTTSDRETINNWCGLPTGYLPKPEYYWDAYGKSNLDADKGYIKDQVSL